MAAVPIIVVLWVLTFVAASWAVVKSVLTDSSRFGERATFTVLGASAHGLERASLTVI